MVITQKQLVAEVRKVAAANPTFVYIPAGSTNDNVRCLYGDKDENNEKGACIIGQALANLGVSNEDRKAWDARAEATIRSLFRYRDDPDYPTADFPVTGDVESDEVEWLRSVQYSQDQGSAWLAAVNEANTEFPDVG